MKLHVLGDMFLAVLIPNTSCIVSRMGMNLICENGTIEISKSIGLCRNPSGIKAPAGLSLIPEI